MDALTGNTANMVFQVIVSILSVGGTWKMAELFLNWRKRQAETKHLEGQYQAQIMQNQREWGDRLEAQLREHKERIQELEAVAEQNKLLNEQVAELQGTVKRLSAENKSLKKQLRKLTGK